MAELSDEDALALAKAQAERDAALNGPIEDTARSLGSGFFEGVTGFADSLFNAARQEVMGGTISGQQKLMSDPVSPAADLGEAVIPGGQSYDPQTQFGKFGKSIGQAASGVVMGPGGILPKIAMAVGGGGVSEAAGQLAHEHAPAWEPSARVGGMLVGSLAGAGRPAFNEVMIAAKKVAKSAPSAIDLRTTTKAMYDAFDNLGIRYDLNTFQGLGQQIHNRLMKAQHRPSNAGPAFAIGDELTIDALKTGSPDFMDMERLSQRIGKQERDARRAGNLTLADAFEIARKEIDNFAITSPLITRNGMATPQQLLEARTTMRATALKSIKARRMDEIFEDADNNPAGFLAGLRSEITTALMNKADQALFNANERVLLKAVRDGNRPVSALKLFGGQKLPSPQQANSSIIASTSVPASVAIGMGSPAALPILAVGGAAAVKRTGGILKPLFASKRMQTAAAAMRSPQFETQLALERLAKNRTRMRQMLAGVPAAQEFDRQMEGKDK